MDLHSGNDSVLDSSSQAERLLQSAVTTPEEVLTRIRLLRASPISHTVLHSLIQQYPSGSPPTQDHTDELADALSLCLELSCRAGDVPIIESIFRSWKSLPITGPLDADTLVELLVEAATRGQVDVVRCLLLHGAKVTGSVPGLVAVNAAKDVDLRPIFRAFIELGGWDINDTSDGGKPALTYLVDRPEILACFLDWGANPNAVGSDGITPLDAAAGLATPAAVDLLLTKGAKIESSYPLHQAVARHGPQSIAMEMVDHLLHLGVDINAIQFQNHPQRVQNAYEDRGTPLHCAARSGSKLRVVHLLSKGADPAKQSSMGNSVLSWAKRARRPKAHPDMLKLLAELE